MATEITVAGLVVLVALAGCGGEPPKPEPAPPRPREAAPVRSDVVSGQLELPKPGSRRALIYTWRNRFPLEVQSDVRWLLSSADYVKTEDFANAWKLVYATGDPNNVQYLQVAACEYVSEDAARQSYDAVLAKLTSPAPLTVESCAKAATAHLADHALALALSSRYLFIFDRPQAKDVGEAVKEIVKACLTEETPR